MASQQTLLDSWMSQAKQRKSETPHSSRTLSSSAEQEINSESCASTASDEETGCLSSEMDSEPPTSDPKPGPTRCIAVCCKVEGIGEPFQTSNHSVLLQTRKRQGSKIRYFLPDWYKAYPWLVLCMTILKAFCYFCRYCYEKDLLDNYVDDAFVTVGFDNWKRLTSIFRDICSLTLIEKL